MLPPKLKGREAVLVEFKGQGPRDGDLDLVLTFVLYEKNVHQPWPLALKCGEWRRRCKFA